MSQVHTGESVIPTLTDLRGPLARKTRKVLPGLVFDIVCLLDPSGQILQVSHARSLPEEEVQQWLTAVQQLNEDAILFARRTSDQKYIFITRDEPDMVELLNPPQAS